MHYKSLIRRVQDPGEALTAKEKETMQPPFPSWRDKEYVLDRRELFKNLRGLLTHGSPLSKFAALWPAIVPLNDERYVSTKIFNGSTSTIRQIQLQENEAFSIWWKLFPSHYSRT